MRSTTVRLALLSVVSLAFTQIAMAQDEAPKPKPKRDPNEMVCERQEVLGSRLGAKKVCMTRAQWDDQRRQDRDNVAQSQLSHCVANAGC